MRNALKANSALISELGIIRVRLSPTAQQITRNANAASIIRNRMIITSSIFCGRHLS